MKRIFYIMGRSGSGKSFLLDKLKADSTIKRHCKTIVNYTTRPIRMGETDGDEYNFVSNEAFESLTVIESRSYDVIDNGQPAVWKYATCIDNIDIEKYYYIGIGTLESYQKIDEYYFDRYGEHVLVPIYITVSDKDLLEHYIHRETGSSKNYDEMCRRFLADKQDFSKEKLDEVGITNRDTFMNFYDGEDRLYNMIAKEILSEIIINEQKRMEE